MWKEGVLETSGDHLTQNADYCSTELREVYIKKLIGLDKSSVYNLIN